MDATLQNFVYEHIANFENVQRNKKNTKKEFIGHQRYIKLDVKISPCQNLTICSVRLAIFVHVKNQPPTIGGSQHLAQWWQRCHELQYGFLYAHYYEHNIRGGYP
jgi:hypothetical protein